MTRIRTTHGLAVLAVLFLLVLPSCSDAEAPTAPSGGLPEGSGETLTITATAANTFDPADSTAGVGVRVTFRNGGGTHNVHMSGLTGLRCAVSCDGAGSGDPSDQAWTFSLVFQTAGVLEFVCDEHPEQTGRIVIQ